MEPRELTGPQKAATLLLALGDAHAKKVFSRMREDEIRDVSRAMSSLGTIVATEVEELCREFSETMGVSGGMFGSLETTERLLLRTMSKDRVAQIMDELRGPAGRTTWEKLGNVSEAVLANYLKSEYPQTVALVLSKVRPEHAARVLSLLPDGFAMEVIMRMLRMEPVQKLALDGVERTLKTEFMSNLARSRRRDPHEMMADIFNNLDRASEARILTALDERNRDSAERIRALMFTFEDLTRLDPAGVQALQRAVEKERLTLALKGASEEIRNLFLSNMSQRAGRMLREDIAGLGPVRLRDVDEAQAAIVVLVKEMAGRGEVRVGDNRDDPLIT